MNGSDGLGERRRGVPWREKADGYQTYQPAPSDTEDAGDLEDLEAERVERGGVTPSARTSSAHGRVQRQAGPVVSAGTASSTGSATPKGNEQKVPRKGQKSAQETKAMLAQLNREARGVEDAKRSARQAEDALKRRREAAAKGRTTSNAPVPTTQRRADGREREAQMRRIQQERKRSRNLFSRLAERLRRKKVEEDREQGVLDRLQRARLARQQRREQAELAAAYRERFEKLERARSAQRQREGGRGEPKGARDMRKRDARDVETRLRNRAEKKYREERVRLLKRYREERRRLSARHRARTDSSGRGGTQRGGRAQDLLRTLRQVRRRRFVRYRRVMQIRRLRRVRQTRLRNVERVQREQRRSRQREQVRRERIQREQRAERAPPRQDRERRERARLDAERQRREQRARQDRERRARDRERERRSRARRARR